jgi:hypothetical protein
MKNILSILLLLMATALFAQQNPATIIPVAAPDGLQGGHPRPAISSMGNLYACQPIAYEGWSSDMSSVYQSDTYALFELGPCSWGQSYQGSWRMATKMELQAVSCWIGTSANARFETVTNIQFWTADGLHMFLNFSCEFDKHQDVTGNYTQNWTLSSPISIPAGTIVRWYRYPGGLIFCGANADPLASDSTKPAPNGWNFCATESHWHLYGTGK